MLNGWALNHDGARAASLTAPNPDAQYDVLTRAWTSAAQSEPIRLAYVEAHGTGTKLGDPIELAAIDRALKHFGHPTVPIGSIKSNLAHLGPAAGLAGLAKALLIYRHKTELHPEN